MIVFMEHFEQVSKERNEEESSVNVRVIERVNDLRRDGRARSTNEVWNNMPHREEISNALN